MGLKQKKDDSSSETSSVSSGSLTAKKIMTMDAGNYLDQLGQFGLFQFFVYVMTAIPALVAGAVALQNVFVMGVPRHRCFIPDCDDSMFPDFSNPACTSYSSDFDSLGNACLQNYSSENGESYSSCQRFVFGSTEFTSTVTTEWDLVCDNSLQLTAASSIFMLGNLVGSFVFGVFADSFGRRSVFYWGPILGCVAGITAAYSTNVYLFTASIFFIAFCATGLYMIGFVLGVEFIGTKYRLWCGNGYQMLFAVGEIVFAAVAFKVRDWRNLELVVAAMIGSLFFLSLILPESVRWYVSKNKPEKAMEVMRKAAKWNGVTLKHNNELTESDSETTDSTESGGFIAIVKHPLLRRWSFNLWFNWATNALVYYGLSLSASKIGDGLDVYTTFMLLAAVEIPFGIAISIIMSLLGRRLPLSVTMMTGGVICLMPAVLPASLSKATVILGVLGKGCITASFALVYFYTAEVYPTNMRSVGLGTSSTFARVGAIIAPFVAEFKGLGESGPLIICGAISLIAGLLALDLPETHKKDLPETIDDVYKLKKGFKATSLTREDELTKSRIP